MSMYPMSERKGVFETHFFYSKEELVEAIEARVFKLKSNYDKKAKNSKKYQEYEKYLDSFLLAVKRMELPKISDEEWSFAFGINELGASVLLTKAEAEDEMHIHIYASYVLRRFETRLLPSDEYAKLHQVSDVTVRQWIRRGKLRDAKKFGNTWRIPEFMEPDKGQYINVFMGWAEKLTDLLPEYEFVNDYDESSIQKMGVDEYKVWFANNKTNDYKIVTMSRSERERFELMMIANPFVDCFNMPGTDIDEMEKAWRRRK